MSRDWSALGSAVATSSKWDTLPNASTVPRPESHPRRDPRACARYDRSNSTEASPDRFPIHSGGELTTPISQRLKRQYLPVARNHHKLSSCKIGKQVVPHTLLDSNPVPPQQVN